MTAAAAHPRCTFDRGQDPIGIDTDFALAPIRLFASDRLLSARHGDELPASAELVTDLDRAMLLENAQDLPDGYRIWRDVMSEALSAFCSSGAAREAQSIVEAECQRIWESRGEFERALKIKRMRKTITDFEEFWLAVAHDLFEMLKSVSLGRHVLGGNNNSVLEAIYATVDAGFYPCGWHDQTGICAFDPRGLDGFRPVWGGRQND